MPRHEDADLISRPEQPASNIYKTQKGLLTLQDQMGITGDEFDKFRHIAITSSTRHLDRNKVISAQDPQDWKRFQTEIINKWPPIRQYEDHWPLRDYMTKYLKQRSRYINGSQARDKQIQQENLAPRKGLSASAPVIKVAPLAGFKPSKPVAKTSRTHRKSFVARSLTPSRKERSSLSAAPVLLPRNLVKREPREPGTAQPFPPYQRQHLQTQPSSTTSDSTTIASSSSQSQSSPASSGPLPSVSGSDVNVQPVRTFLQSLPQPLDDLLPLFLSVGIKNALALTVLASLDDRDSWLYALVREGKMTKWEFKLVTDGLEKISMAENN
ncbi:hypothetical protein AcV5_006192 [Taiwanofungus camphoratus]|nr:hypothetical protein AcV5_006192 [Antrodia cinnamomea]KAI0950403.1 hypothetical protein AcV7_008879 [Antrodia cinnamomea]